MENFNEFISDLKDLIAIDTTLKNAEGNAPFGEQTAKALNLFLDIAKRLGFNTRNYENYIGEVWYGEGEEIGVIGHLDIVPVGNGWDSDPFTLTKKDGKYFGRGVCDDKGPTLLSLYALNALKNEGVKFNRKIRLFAGTNEECGWKDVEYFSKNYAFPEYGISPDGDFPVSYSEKGVYPIKVKLPKFNNFNSLCGGVAVNAVCDYATVIQTSTINNELLNKYGLEKDGNKIISRGLSAHGSAPTLGKNAFLPLFSYMRDCGENLTNIIDYLFLDKKGIMQLENEQGNVTLSPDIVEYAMDNPFIICDLRVPAPMSFEKDVAPILDTFNITYTVTGKHPPFMVEKNGWFVQTLIDSYNNITHEGAVPVKMSGSTFARAFRKGCAFGVEFPNYDYKIHTANENMPEEHILKTYEILKEAFKNLVK